jgi:hypothetical protein
MKKNVLTTLMLLVALMAQAQNSVTIKPTLKTGMAKAYTIKSESTVPGSMAADVTGDLSYKVTDKTADGYQIDMLSSFSNIDANQLFQKMSSADILQLMNNMKVELLTDKMGKVNGIKNTKQLIDKNMAMYDSLFHATLDQNPMLKDNPMVKESMEKSVKMMEGMLTEDFLMESFIQTPNILSLNGKTITDGMVEDGTFAQILTTKSTYSLQNGGKTIVQTIKGDMDAASMKKYLAKTLSTMLPESVAKEANPEELNTMIETMVSNGSMKMDMNIKATYDLDDDGWVKKLVTEMDMNMPGQAMKMRQVMTRK